MKTTVLLVILQLAAVGNDAYWTDHNLHGMHFVEHNPLAVPFVKNRPELITTMSLSAAAQVIVPRLLRKRHHNHFARFVELTTLSGDVYGGVSSAVRSQ